MATKFTKSNMFAGLDDFVDDLETVKAKESQDKKFPMLRPSFGGRKTKKARKSPTTNMTTTSWSSTVKKAADLPTPTVKSRSPTKTPSPTGDKDYHKIQVFSEKKAKQIAEFNKRIDERMSEMENEMFECLEDAEIDTWMKEKQDTEELNEYYDNIDDYEHDEDTGYDSY